MYSSESTGGNAVVRPLVFHQCGPGSIPGRGLSLLLVLVLAPRGFSPGTPVFPFPSKNNVSKFQFHLESEGHKFVSRNRVLSATLVKQTLFIYLLLSELFSFQECRRLVTSKFKGAKKKKKNYASLLALDWKGNNCYVQNPASAS